MENGVLLGLLISYDFTQPALCFLLCWGGSIISYYQTQSTISQKIYEFEIYQE